MNKTILVSIVGVLILGSTLLSCRHNGANENSNGPQLLALMTLLQSTATWLPAAATSDASGNQGVQNDLYLPENSGSGFNLATSGTPTPSCRAAGVVIALWERAVCYVHSDGKLYCSGRIGETNFGSTFSDAQVPGSPRQLIGSPTFNHTFGSAACALLDNGKAWCLGYGGRDKAQTSGVYWGQFRTANDADPGSAWTQWGSRSDIKELATGTMDQVCARYGDKTADCVGQTGTFATPPMGVFFSTAAAVPHSNSVGVNKLWLDDFGLLHVNDDQTFRVSNSRSECIVVPEGLACRPGGDIQITRNGISFGIVSSPADAGHVVDGLKAAGDGGKACWLTDKGKVYCRSLTDHTITQHFTAGKVLAIAGNFYAGINDLCVVYNNGSVWCKGSNSFGQFGTGSTNPLNAETEVQGPGSARISCAN